MTKEYLNEDTKLVKFFCNKKKEQLTVYISNPDSSVSYTVNKHDCSKIQKAMIKGKNFKASFYLSDQSAYVPLNKYDSIIINKLINLTDSLSWCNDALRNGKSLIKFSKK